MRLRFILSEIGIGLRRNLSMTISVVLVTFVSLTFVGSAALLQLQIGKMKDDWYDKVEVSVFLCPATSPEPTCAGGEVTVTYGSYEKRNATAQIGMPIGLGEASGGLHAYGELDDSFSFYRGLHPSHQLLELSGNLALRDWTFAADYMYYHSNGDVQTPGWNRLTQNLIDSGTYITGRNSSLRDRDGNGRLTLDELGGNPHLFDPNFQALACAGCQARLPGAQILSHERGRSRHPGHRRQE